MTETNPYNPYIEDAILNSHPLGLVVALYEGAIDACVVARTCIVNRDIPGRTKAVNKVVNILDELMRSLNDEKGGEISQNLRRLYVYIVGLLTQANRRQDAAPLTEAEKLLSTMLEGWKGANARFEASTTLAVPATSLRQSQSSIPEPDYGYAAAVSPYGSYLPEATEYSVSSAYSY